MPITESYYRLKNPKLPRKTISISKLNKKNLNNLWVKEEITRESGKYFKMNDEEYIIHRYLWELKAMPREI